MNLILITPTAVHNFEPVRFHTFKWKSIETNVELEACSGQFLFYILSYFFFFKQIYCRRPTAFGSLHLQVRTILYFLNYHYSNELRGEGRVRYSDCRFWDSKLSVLSFREYPTNTIKHSRLLLKRKYKNKIKLQNQSDASRNDIKGAEKEAWPIRKNEFFYRTNIYFFFPSRNRIFFFN